ncbi:MAG: hypothetical protein LBD58_11385 [Treponema sp.]|jgi:enoyl-[acyl-carrier protein] reductase/trans-2-enoyl-CoA reductase (NAD+)|nr:hypothetical protein [Treponema sp.]
MIIKPMVRSNICINSRSIGCEMALKRQIIAYVKNCFSEDSERQKMDSPAVALVTGCSTGHGHARRRAAAFGYEAAIIGVSLEKPVSDSVEIKAQTVQAVREADVKPRVDLVCLLACVSGAC